MKREWSKARQKGIKERFDAWCKENRKPHGWESLLEFDKLNPAFKLIDHDLAKKEGYAYHLQKQAREVISRWAAIFVAPAKASGIPSVLEVNTRENKPLRMQDRYNIPGRGTVLVNDMDENELRFLMNQLGIEAENKAARAYEIGKRLGTLTETRKQVQEILRKAEEAAYQRATAS